MTRTQAVVWSLFFMLAGGGGFGYLLLNHSPWQPDGNLNIPLIALFLGALFWAATGLGAVVALILHRRFPLLGGGSRYSAARPHFALRQGFLFACVLLANALLAFFALHDVIFLLATPLLAGLVEAYLQHRPVRR
jgi:hypothetical protein